MTDLKELAILLQYTGQNIALFTGGLFSGAAIYLSLSERPPRTPLYRSDVLAICRSVARLARVFGMAAALTTFAALAAAFALSSFQWLLGGAVYAVMVVYLFTNATIVERSLDYVSVAPDPEADGRRLLRQRAFQYAVLSLAGMFAQYLFIVSR